MFLTWLYFKSFNNINLYRHIAEHMEIKVDTSKMTDDELLFHYFKMNDHNGDDKLDGIELVKAFTHRHG